MSVVPKSQCTRFVQNAWKKNFCSNCYKTREEHEDTSSSKTAASMSKMEKISMITATTASSVKSIIKVNLPSTAAASSKSRKKKSVNFPKEMSEIIGFDGGEWSDSNESDDDCYEIDDVSKAGEVVYVEDEHLQKVTKNNTEFNMNNGNLLGDPTVNIKKTFAALKLGEFRVFRASSANNHPSYDHLLFICRRRIPLKCKFNGFLFFLFLLFLYFLNSHTIR